MDNYPENIWIAFADNDFQNMWAGAKSSLQGKIDILFDLKAYQEILPMPGQPYVWSYPPHLLLLIFPFGFLSYIPALILWNVSGLAIFLYICCYGFHKKLEKRDMLLLSISPACLLNIAVGQNGLFIGALFISALIFLMRKKRLAAGILIGILTVKPHIGILIPVVLIALKDWRTIIISATTCLTMIAVSVLIWGITPWELYLTKTGPLTLQFIRYFGDQLYTYMMGTVYSGLRPWFSYEISLSLNLLAALSAAVLTFVAIYKKGLNYSTLFLLSIASMITIPYGYNYDMAAMTGCGILYFAFLVSSGQKLKWYHWNVIGPLWALPFLTCAARFHTIPIVPIILLASFYYIYKEIMHPEGLTESKIPRKKST